MAQFCQEQQQHATGLGGRERFLAHSLQCRARPPALSGGFPRAERPGLRGNGHIALSGHFGHWRMEHGGGSFIFWPRQLRLGAMYDNGKVIYVGGGPPWRTAEVIDLNATSSAWTRVAPMPQARRQHNVTILPEVRFWLQVAAVQTASIPTTVPNPRSTGIRPPMTGLLGPPKRISWVPLEGAFVARWPCGKCGRVIPKHKPPVPASVLAPLPVQGTATGNHVCPVERRCGTNILRRNTRLRQRHQRKLDSPLLCNAHEEHEPTNQPPGFRS